MRVTLISASDNDRGASRSAYRLHLGLRRLGLQSKMFVRGKVTGDPDVLRYQPTKRLFSGLARNWRRYRLNRSMTPYEGKLPREHTFFTDDRTSFLADPLEQIPDADVLHLHWVAEFLDYSEFFAWLPKAKPFVWTLHDMANLTGGCCYDLGCGKFAQSCGQCPQLGSRVEKDLSREVWTRKKREYTGLDPGRVRIVTPSRWLAREVGRSPLLGRFPCCVIPYGLDLETFQPRDRRVARELFGVPAEAKVLLFMADKVTDFRKGYHLFEQALQGVSPDEMFVICAGGEAPPGIQRFRHAVVDGIANDRVLSFVYSAADVFVAPSLADNLPNTVLEAIACGVPVVAFDAGGVPDLVRPRETGTLVETGDATELRNAILQLLHDSRQRMEMAANCRRIAVQEYELTIQAQRYKDVYEDLAGRKCKAAQDDPVPV